MISILKTKSRLSVAIDFSFSQNVNLFVVRRLIEEKKRSRRSFINTPAQLINQLEMNLRSINEYQVDSLSFRNPQNVIRLRREKFCL